MSDETRDQAPLMAHDAIATAASRAEQKDYDTLEMTPGQLNVRVDIAAAPGAVEDDADGVAAASRTVDLDADSGGSIHNGTAAGGDADNAGRGSRRYTAAVSDGSTKTDASSAPPQPSAADLKRLDLKRLLEQAKPERCILIVATVSLAFGAITNLLIPGIAGVIIDAISGDPAAVTKSSLGSAFASMGYGDDPRTILNIAVAVLALTIIVSTCFTALRGYLYTLAGERVVARLRKKLFSAVLVQDISFFDMTRTGELINRLSSDTTILGDACTRNISMGLRWAATIIGGVMYLFFISWKLTLVMLSVVPLVAIGGRYYGNKIRVNSKAIQDALAQATVVAEESISSVRTVRSFYREPLQIEKYSERVDQTYKLGAYAAQLYGVFGGAIGFIASAALVLVLWYGAKLVLDGELTPGVLTAFILYTLTVGFAMGGLADLFGTLMKAVGANERVFALMDRAPRINIAGGTQLESFAGRVQFQAVSFAYPSRPQISVLSGVTLELKPGTVTALVGPSGGGKTTVVSLIERFYDVTHGRILIDGKDVRELDPAWLHRHIGLVSQEPVLFATSIRENLLYGVESATDDQIRKACQMANAHEFIIGFTEGYDTIVGERGVRLSGGQKQRVAIARAILMDPKILIADEATSSLDAESEHHVQEALDRLMKNRTVLVVAHRLSTVKNADNVLVIDKGTVVEEGTHDQLLKRSGTYAKLVRRQLQDAPGATAEA